MALIHGDNTVFENTKTALKGLMDALKTAMDGAGDDPRPSAIYEGHEQHTMSFPALSVGLNSASIIESEAGIGASGTIALPMHIVCEIRVHTDYEEGFLDKIKCWRLLNSVINYVTTNMNSYFNSNLTGYQCPLYEDTEFSVDESFDESLTIGGFVRFGISVVFSHTQA